MFPIHSLLAFASLAALVASQQAGNLTAEKHPTLQWQTCTSGGSCSNASGGQVVLDSNWRWLHHKANYTNCFDGNTWETSYCPDGTACANNCALEGADYSGTYGITTSSNSLTLKFMTKGEYGTNIGSRVYLMESETKYKMFNLLNQEFTFDVDLSKLGCGLNGALYFVEMDADGGMAKYTTNKAGAKFGTGYCDAQCPHDIKFISGKANVDGWNPSDKSENTGKGKYGTCCAEMDVWEANSMATAYTPHPCSINGTAYQCEGTACGDGAERYKSVCDKDGCDFNSFRMGDQSFYGKGKTVDTTKKMTVVTQFITSNNSTSGTLSEIRRIYVQNGKVFQNSQAAWDGVTGNSITDAYCDAQKIAFGDENQHKALGGLKKMGDSMKKGMVLVMSVWDDYEAEMMWLDSSYPLDKPFDQPGIKRGECEQHAGAPEKVEAEQTGASVTFSNIKFGPIGSTFKAA